MVRTVVLALACAIGAMSAFAAEVSPPPERDALPRVSPGFASVLQDYRAWREPKLVPWKRANEEVARLGGHAGHLRGGAAPMQGDDTPNDRRLDKR